MGHVLPYCHFNYNVLFHIPAQYNGLWLIHTEPRLILSYYF